VESATAFFPWREVFEDLLGIRGTAEPGARRARVQGAMARLSPRDVPLLPLLNPVILTDFAETPATTALRDQARGAATMALLGRLLVLFPEPGAHKAILLEDAHCFDSASWLLVGVARHSPGVLLLITTRPIQLPEVAGIDAAPRTTFENDRRAALPRRVEAWSPPMTADTERRVASPRRTEDGSPPAVEDASALHIRLQSLGAEGAIQVACNRLGVTALPESVAELIRSRSEGNPLFSEELAYALRDSGALVIEDGACRLGAGDLAAVAIPTSVQAAMTSRIDRLPVAEQMWRSRSPSSPRA
jgi:hypothetical protein